MLPKIEYKRLYSKVTINPRQFGQGLSTTSHTVQTSSRDKESLVYITQLHISLFFVSVQIYLLLYMALQVWFEPTIRRSLDDSMSVSLNNTYSLVATINHSGTLLNGHYTAFVKDHHSNAWYHCNDKSVTSCPKEKVVNNSSYLLFYRRF